jgi:hypothetical protein
MKLAIAVLLLAVGPVEAKTKSWAVLEGSVPADATVVGSFDVKAASAAKSFPKLVEALTADGDVKQVVSVIKQNCSIDLVASISDVSFAVADKAQGVVAIGLDGIDQKKVEDCLDKITKALAPKAKLSTKPGKITEYVIDDGGDKESLFLAWPQKDVVVVGTKPDKRKFLDAWASGKAPSGDVAAWIGKASTAQLAWVAGKIKDPDVKGGWATATLAKGSLTLAAKVVTTDAQVAQKGLAEAKKTLAKLTSDKGVPADVLAVLKSVKLGVVGVEIAAEAAVQEADLPTLIPAFEKLF